MSVPIGYNGRGTQISFATDGADFTPATQLTRFEPGGSKQRLVDNTDLGAPGNFTTSIPTLIDAGDIDCEGILNPQDPATQQLALIHGQGLLAQFIITLPDNETIYFCTGYVSEFKPFSIAVSKTLRYSWKLRIVGAIAGPGSAFQPNAFQPGAFQAVLI